MRRIDVTRLRPIHVDLAGAAVCALLVLLGYLIGIRPLVVRRKEMAAQEAALDDRYRDAAKLAGTVTALKKRLAGVKKELAESPVKLQPANRINERIARVADLAADCGMKIDEIQPDKSFSTPRFQTVPIRVVGSGNFKACVKLLRTFRDAFPDTAISSFELKGNPRQPAAPARFQVELLWYAAADPRLARR